MRQLIILLVIEIFIPIDIVFFIILSYFVIFKESYTTKNIKIKCHFVKDHVEKGGFCT